MHPVPKAISRRHTDDVFFEELLAIEILAERPDRWGVPRVLPDFQPIPSCWVRPRRLPRRVSGHLHLEREFLICFTPPRPRCGLGRCDGALQNLGRGGEGVGEGRGIQPSPLRPPNQPHGPKASSIPVGCSLAAALPYSDLDLFTGQSKYTLAPARSESPLIIVAGDQIMRVGGSVLPSAHDLINFPSIGYR